MEVKVFDIIPTEIQKNAEDFLRFLGGPAIINAGPNTDENVFISCLMHGNEPSGYFAVHKILQKISKQHHLKKKVHFAFMNVRAALEGEMFSHRFCDDEQDMNRVWGAGSDNASQDRIVKFMMNFIEKNEPELVVDIHNTTGSNPVFAIINSLDKESIKAAAVASEIIWSHSGSNTIINWSKDICPSIGVECGKNIDPLSDDNAVTVLRNLLIHFGALEGEVQPKQNIRLLYEAEPIKVDTHDIYVADENSGHDMVLINNIEGFNTVELNPGTKLGWVNKPNIINNSAVEVVDRILKVRSACTFILITTCLDAIDKDALGYRAKQKLVSLQEIIDQGENILYAATKPASTLPPRHLPNQRFDKLSSRA